MSKILSSFQLFLLALIIITSGSMLFYTALTDSAIFDESAHIPAGYSYVRYFDYRLNHEHPPIVKALSGIPLLFLDLKFPTDDPAWTTNVNDQWTIGGKFFYQLSNDADQIIFLARIGPVILTLLTIILIYFFARRFVGGAWALLPTFLFAFSPIVLAHGHYVTTDVGASFGAVLAFYTFFNYLEKKTWGSLALAGIGFGTAQLLKFSNVLLGPAFVIILALWYFIELRRNWQSFPANRRFIEALKSGLREAGNFILIMIVAFLLVYTVYAIFIANYPQEKQIADINSVLGGKYTGIFKNIAVWMAQHSPFRPLAQYVFGVFSVLKRTVGGNAAYFLGQLSGKGWWYYFPLVYAIKETLPALILIALGIYAAIRRSFPLGSSAECLERRFYETSMLIYVSFYWINSMVSPLNIGVRHILPTLPFIYLLTAISLKEWVFPGAKINIGASDFLAYLKKIGRSMLKLWWIGVLLLWLIVEVAIVSPNYLSYFNELAGGSINGYRYVTDSNYDWGQDLYRLKDFVEKNHIQKIAVDYFGGGSPGYTLGGKEENWWSARGNPKKEGIEWIAISANVLEGALAKLTPGFERKPEDEYRWLKELRDSNKPDARAGYSIFIFKLQ